MSCKTHTINSSVDEDGLCVSCGKDLSPRFEKHCGGCLVMAENAKLKEALKAWQLMDSESYDKNKAPCHIMRAEYRRSARELTEQVLKE